MFTVASQCFARKVSLVTDDRFAAFVFRTRGIYMFIALAVSMVLRASSHGTTPRLLFILSLGIAGLVQAFRMYAAGYLWGRQAVTKPSADFLCTSGPYAHVRNPMYLGNLLIGLALCIAINVWYAYALFVSSYVVVYSIVIPYEERFLQDKYGHEYISYKAQTGRLLPRLKAYTGGTEVVPNYKAGILGELHVPVFLAVFSVVLYLLLVK